MRNIFAGFAEIPAPDDNPYAAKWNAVKDAALAATVGGVSDGVFTFGSLSVLNAAVNGHVLYQRDPDDDWKTPFDTFESMVGDCEDYANLKRAILLQHGFPRDRANLILGTLVAGTFEDHAFLVVDLDGERLILDNKFDQLVRPADYVNFVPKVLLTNKGVFTYMHTFTIAELAKKPPTEAGG